MTTAIEARLNQLEDRFALQDLTSDYCLGFDKRDFDRFLAIWWPDARWEIGPPFGNFEGHAGVTRAVKEILWPAWLQSTHYTTNLIIVPESTTLVHGVCDVYCIGTTTDCQAQTVSATDVNRFEKRGDVWKIAERKVTMHHFSPLVGITLSAPL